MPDPNILWQPSPSVKENSNLTAFMRWLSERDIRLSNYDELHRWSIDNVAQFWALLLPYFNVQYSGSFEHVLQGKMPDSKWFEGLALNYAEHIFRNQTIEAPAILFSAEDGTKTAWSWEELYQKVSGLQQFFLSAGIEPGDRIVAYLPNIPEATVAFLAANSIGAVWSSCSPDFGAQAVLDRFLQTSPKIFIGSDGYTYGGKYFDKSEALSEIISALPTVEKIILISWGMKKKEIRTHRKLQPVLWDEIKPSEKKIQFTRVPFSHPIWILYSSGTTGMPKAITHGTGGVLLEQLKYLSFHQDIKKGEHCFWYTTTGWMMWNYLQGSLLMGGTLVLYDGHPAYPNRNTLWNLIDTLQINHFGISGSYIVSNMKSDIHPAKEFSLRSLRSIGSTGSPLPAAGFQWIYEKVKRDVWLASMSGGTDVCSAFVGGNPLLPVYEGEIQCAALGCDIQVWDETGNRLKNEEGEMIIAQAMPSMPVFFWNDPGGKKYSESYFEMFPHAWRHGDWIKQNNHGGIIIYGRSDATLNRGGVRIGSAEIYKTLDKITELNDCLIVCLDKPNGEFYMPLFVSLSAGVVLDDLLKAKIKRHLKTECSPRHVPDAIVACPDIPYTLSGKKTEMPVKKILMGKDPEKVVNAGSLRNPKSLKFFHEFFQSLLH